MFGNSWVATQLAASQEGLFSVKLVSEGPSSSLFWNAYNIQSFLNLHNNIWFRVSVVLRRKSGTVVLSRAESYLKHLFFISMAKGKVCCIQITIVDIDSWQMARDVQYTPCRRNVVEMWVPNSVNILHYHAVTQSNDPLLGNFVQFC
jgi:hypothetical protein